MQSPPGRFETLMAMPMFSASFSTTKSNVYVLLIPASSVSVSEKRSGS